MGVDSLLTKVCWESGTLRPENAQSTIPALASKSWRRHVRYRSLPGKVADLSMQLATI